jgi:hypothetical protein
MEHLLEEIEGLAGRDALADVQTNDPEVDFPEAWPFSQEIEA